MSWNDENLRTSFDRSADLYQQARPEYPDRLFDRLLALTGLAAGDEVLEVGAGPGKATLPLARRGLLVTALEPGPVLVKHARKNLAAYPVQVVQTRFEDWAAPAGRYAAVVAATSWHWIDPAVRYQRAAVALRPGGSLATWSAGHVFPVNGDPFFEEIQQVYEEIGEATPRDAIRPAPGELVDSAAEVRASGLFDVETVEHFDWTVDYDADTYIQLLSTFSGHIAMAPDRRDRLFNEIRRRLSKRPDGLVRRGWGAALTVARRRPPAEPSTQRKVVSGAGMPGVSK